MKKIVATCIILMSSMVYAATQYVNGITWTYTVVNGKASIGGGSSASRAVSVSTSGGVTIPDSLGGCPVASIGSYAFSDCSGITSVTIPDSVTSIGSHVFRGCCGLMSFTVGAGNADYKSENGLLLSKNGKTLIAGINGDVTIPDSVTSIWSGAFSGCSGLTSVTIPGGVTSIGYSVFSDCSGLASVTIPNSVTSIGSFAFYNCCGLTSVTIPKSVTSIGSDAFRGCSGLTMISVDLGNVNYKSENGLLLSYDGKTLILGVNGDVTIPDGVTSIGSYAFYNCNKLTSVNIPYSVEHIGDLAFTGCSRLTNVTAPGWQCGIPFANVTNLVVSAGTVNIQDGAFSNCVGLLNVTIPVSVTNIGAYAFHGCSGLSEVVIPESVASIGMSAFSNCGGLLGLTLNEGLKDIGASAFYSCSNLTGPLVIPNGVKKLVGLLFMGVVHCQE